METCEACLNAAGVVLRESPASPVGRGDDPDYPGFGRVARRVHVGEMTDLAAANRQCLMDVVPTLESVVRRHFSQPVWAAVPRDEIPQRPRIDNEVLRRELASRLGPIEDQRRKTS